MAKKKTNSKKQKPKEEPVLPKEDQEKPFDFGGLPQRDLKKSLGCG
jgi:hypothetical protein